jgi:hypothetical protein
MLIRGCTNLLDVCLGLRIKGAVKVGFVGLQVARATDGVLLVIGVDAASGEDREVNLLEEANICQVEGSNDIAADGLLLVVFAPINIGAAGATSTVQDVGGLDLLDLLNHSLAVLHANCGGEDLLALALEEGLEMASDPSLATPDEVDIVGGTVGGSHDEQFGSKSGLRCKRFC